MIRRKKVHKGRNKMDTRQIVQEFPCDPQESPK